MVGSSLCGNVDFVTPVTAGPTHQRRRCPRDARSLKTPQAFATTRSFNSHTILAQTVRILLKQRLGRGLRALIAPRGPHHRTGRVSSVQLLRRRSEPQSKAGRALDPSEERKGRIASPPPRALVTSPRAEPERVADFIQPQVTHERERRERETLRRSSAHPPYYLGREQTRAAAVAEAFVVLLPQTCA